MRCKCDFCYCKNQIDKNWGKVCNDCLNKKHMDIDGTLVDEDGQPITPSGAKEM